MDWTAKIDQQQDALLRVFYMFIGMVLVVISSGLDRRAAAGCLPFRLPQDDDPASAVSISSDLSDELDRLYANVLALLYAAEMAARRLTSLFRDIYELMQQAHVLAQSLRGDDCKAGGRLNLLGARLDAP